MSKLIWFRSDLRIKDNPALFHAIQACLKTKPHSLLVATYIFSPADFKSHDVAACKVDFILRNLRSLSQDLWSQFRIPLLIRTASTVDTVESLLSAMINKYKVDQLFFNAEYEVDESRRDKRIMAQCESEWNVSVHRFDDQCVILPGLLRSKNGEGNVYTVFTPFKRSWYQKVYQNSRQVLHVWNAQELVASSKLNSDLHGIQGPDAVPDFLQGFEIKDEAFKKTLLQLWPAGETFAHDKLEKFAASRLIDEYEDQRNMVANETGTSGLSTYLASGVLSAKQCVVKALGSNGNKLDSGKKGIVCWISELVWRDFYRHILVAYPRVCMNKPFKLQTLNVPWRFDEAEFKAWCTGRTGYPIVDAGMRQLLATGWMHNRSRMIVGSFLTKHLLHNWQLGEKFFNEHLIDGDFASNNGGWQWVASTGTDSQPYFRVFNPYNQSERFDPDGKYIRKWVPELASVKDNAAIHDPAGVLGKAAVERLGYVMPIVKHELGRNRAIQAFKQSSGSKDEAEKDGDEGETKPKKKSSGVKRKR